ncbi:type VI secretion system-associated FHA domain protein TagH [Candidatus Thiothrix sp. Deng01]|uniref:Type VI secretion system-associated FHA domain protein TagH n=1 Tax=Candidatus Thiothrix phosphatis TaxID=3112415 RepID=A0ABU6CYX2_9GAMM|nr:type VI secretion system-associated FHA domain protein TagH [Candidatus Thiothrix sp. Deng01]MEB4591277.1 type VI secretion system-associated FHA domain protein TagH [Candidatus Thiothrix sp. Deng01]
MELTLKVIRFSNRPPDRPLSHTWTEQGGTLGRNAGNDWVLPDTQRFLSGQHARIEYREGAFVIRDTSTNGVFINQSKAPLGKNNTQVLQAGDQIRLGLYELEVELAQAGLAGKAGAAAIAPDWAATGGWEKDPFDFLEPGAEPKPGKQAPPPVSSSVADNAFYIPDIIIQQPAEADAGKAIPPPDSQGSGLPANWWDDPAPPATPAIPSGHEEPPPPPTGKPAVAATFDDDPFAELAPAASTDPTPVPEPAPEEIPAPVPKPRPAAPVFASPGNNSGLQVFLQGAGIQDTGKLAAIEQAQNLEALGRLFRIAIQGTLDVLQARAEIKSAMRMDVTTIQRIGNNPLKFSVTADDALNRLLSPRTEAYLPPEQALLEAFDDIRAHQLAVIAGVQAALTQVLKRFDPALLIQRLEKNNPVSASIPIQRQAKLWELFEELYATLEQECQDDFQRLFGLEFARAYDEQIAKLKREPQHG